MNFGSKMMLVGEIVELFFLLFLCWILSVSEIIFHLPKGKKKRILENTVKYFLLRNACSFCIHNMILSVKVFLQKDQMTS